MTLKTSLTYDSSFIFTYRTDHCYNIMSLSLLSVSQEVNRLSHEPGVVLPLLWPSARIMQLEYNTQVFLNLELHLSPLAPRHSSLAAALNYRRTRHTAFQQLQEEQQGGNTTHRGQGEQVNRDPHYNERLL